MAPPKSKAAATTDWAAVSREWRARGAAARTPEVDAAGRAHWVATSREDSPCRVCGAPGHLTPGGNWCADHKPVQRFNPPPPPVSHRPRGMNAEERMRAEKLARADRRVIDGTHLFDRSTREQMRRQAA